MMLTLQKNSPAAVDYCLLFSKSLEVKKTSKQCGHAYHRGDHLGEIHLFDSYTNSTTSCLPRACASL